MEYPLLTSCCGIFVVASFVVGYFVVEYVVAESLLWNLCCRIFVVESSMMTSCGGIFVWFYVVEY